MAFVGCGERARERQALIDRKTDVAIVTIAIPLAQRADNVVWETERGPCCGRADSKAVGEVAVRVKSASFDSESQDVAELCVGKGGVAAVREYSVFGVNVTDVERGVGDCGNRIDPAEDRNTRDCDWDVGRHVVVLAAGKVESDSGACREVGSFREERDVAEARAICRHAAIDEFAEELARTEMTEEESISDCSGRQGFGGIAPMEHGSADLSQRCRVEAESWKATRGRSWRSQSVFGEMFCEEHGHGEVQSVDRGCEESLQLQVGLRSEQVV